MYVFPSPQRSGSLVLVLDVFPFAGMSALFSDAVDYRFRVRPTAITSSGAGTAFAVSEQEYVFSCRFAAPLEQEGGGPPVQEGTCTAANGQTVSFRVNDDQGGQAEGLRVFAGVRRDPFFFDGVKALETIVTRTLAFAAQGTSTVFRQNVLSIVIELEVATLFGAGDGSLFAVVGETVTTGSLKVRLERFGRAEIKNFLLLPKDFDTVNRDIEMRDLYNQEDAFTLGRAYGGAYRARMNANLAFWDGLDGKTDWPPDAHGIHPLTEFLLADFMVVDVSKPYAEDTYFEIEQMVLQGAPHRTCGGRSLNDDSIDTFLTFLVNAGHGPRISDGVDQATVPASRTFPYLAPPEPTPPAPQVPAIGPR
jgi:hypothetical protein